MGIAIVAGLKICATSTAGHTPYLVCYSAYEVRVLYSSAAFHIHLPATSAGESACLSSALRALQLHRAVLRSDPGTGRRKALWRTPVRCRITGAITLSALEGRSGKDSPQTLVTCIVRADFGGWLGSDSMFYSWGQVGS